MLAIKTSRNTTLVWDETTPGAWRWLTFGQLCAIADRGRAADIGPNCFVYVSTEANQVDARVCEVSIKDVQDA